LFSTAVAQEEGSLSGERVVVHIMAVILACAACVSDLRSRRIPNSLILLGALAGVVMNTLDSGFQGTGRSLAGAGLGLALLFPFYALGGMGAGDIKLIAALGSLAGPADVVKLALAAALAGGALAVSVAAWEGRLRETLHGVRTLLSFWLREGVKPSPVLTLQNPSALKIPYALPIAVGALAVALTS